MTSRRGVTLIELMVTLVLMAVLARVAVLAIHDPPRPDPTNPRVIVQAARSRAVEQGIAVDTTIVVDGVTRPVTVLPDGRVIADSVVGVNRLTAAFPDSGA